MDAVGAVSKFTHRHAYKAAVEDALWGPFQEEPLIPIPREASPAEVQFLGQRHAGDFTWHEIFFFKWRILKTPQSSRLFVARRSGEE